MDFAFYHHEQNPQGWRKAIVPVRRALRRVQRPYFVRLKDLLVGLWQSDKMLAEDLRKLRMQLEEMEEAHQALVKSHRALEMDRDALASRLAQIEDVILENPIPRKSDKPRLLAS
ncbi:hypothetical protein KIH39_06550 [Telmatocola sphagniphila]|uniref:Uncharacterized protein n=1 Tax=Telmatocola sphagniphila TaxID=1123043 RepID=A0A8E6B7Z9_9BACT|nr:hypothetical protein [Telmatocola sphagniphila]QVL33567.1 hypothetical protein KIH39_06550 [Telmatocola sphagniphila]